MQSVKQSLGDAKKRIERHSPPPSLTKPDGSHNDIDYPKLNTDLEAECSPYRILFVATVIVTTIILILITIYPNGTFATTLMLLGTATLMGVAIYNYSVSGDECWTSKQYQNLGRVSDTWDTHRQSFQSQMPTGQGQQEGEGVSQSYEASLNTYF